MSTPRTCRVCGCTDQDCSGCIERTGEACHWVGEDLCSACAPGLEAPDSLAPEGELARLPGVGHTTFVRVRRGEPLIEIGDMSGKGFSSGVEVIERAVHPPGQILKVRHRREPLRPDVGEVRQDFSGIQARHAGKRRDDCAEGRTPRGLMPAIH